MTREPRSATKLVQSGPVNDDSAVRCIALRGTVRLARTYGRDLARIEQMHMEIQMNKLLAIAVGAVVLLGSGATLAQEAKAPSPKASTNQSATMMAAHSPMGQMDERMKGMQIMHEKVMSATTPEERQKLMDEQRKEMQSSMAMMNQAMSGGAMMGGGMTGPKGKPADTASQMQVMQKRMDMMQMMMQTMMDQLPPSPAKP